MTDQFGETLSALFDGEPVDADVLEQALESIEGRRLLVSFARSRAALVLDPVEPRIDWQAQMARRLSGPTRTPRGALSHRVVAGLVAASLAAGLALDRWWVRRPDAPPRAVQVLRFGAAEWAAGEGAK
jgi:hypothetical protein